ncbi:uncharacterized protein J4E79_011278 [Alternaria viburni]|uniref:uncharacterized protein n=1 Tax=Alternaria viburni TaxID=566460 RepID=UPI0020C46A6B|nr:uncharacterized protein J4E79_011278 [Alternaria viburni]KAI4643337.1 hypothetical protein J4E79_011278 [Alternaria viburni]
MQRNIVIFLIILILFILIAAIAYLIYYLQTRMAVGGTASSVSDMTENVEKDDVVRIYIGVTGSCGCMAMRLAPWSLNL